MLKNLKLKLVGTGLLLTWMGLTYWLWQSRADWKMATKKAEADLVIEQEANAKKQLALSELESSNRELRATTRRTQQRREEIRRNDPDSDEFLAGSIPCALRRLPACTDSDDKRPITND